MVRIVPVRVFTSSQCPTHFPLIEFHTCAYIASFETCFILTVSSRHCAEAGGLLIHGASGAAHLHSHEK